MILAATQDANPSGAPDPDLVTPGTIGFVVTLAIVIVVIFLIRDALKRVRRVRARSEADDAYPIPLRKYAVPNQSKLSGESAPVDEAAEQPTEAADQTDDVTAETDGSAQTDVSQETDEHGQPKPGPTPPQD